MPPKSNPNLEHALPIMSQSHRPPAQACFSHSEPLISQACQTFDKSNKVQPLGPFCDCCLQGLDPVTLPYIVISLKNFAQKFGTAKKSWE